jgi:hypothetical protein
MEQYIKIGLAGALFGVWPLIMNRSGLEGIPSATVFVIIQVIIVASVGIYIGLPGPSFNWTAAIGASFLSSVGILTFVDAMVKAPKQDAGRLLIIMTLVQIAAAALYHSFFIGGDAILRHGAGIAAAVLAIFLLM